MSSGECSEQIRPGIVVKGDKAFRDKVKADIKEIEGTKSGKALLDSIGNSGKTTTIVKTSGGNSENAKNFGDGLMGSDGKPGKGSDSEVSFNPDKTVVGDGSEPWMKRPTSVGLAHELIHSAHDANGTTEFDYSDKTKSPQNYELQTVGLSGTKDGKPIDYSNNAFTENKIRGEMGQASRPEY